jgi:hypothetical protein
MRYSLITLMLLSMAACNNSGPLPVQSNERSMTNTSNKTDRSQTAIAHSLENQTPPPAANAPEGKSKWTQSGDAIDTKEFDAAITSAEAAVKSKPADAAAKKALGDAYFKRAEAL